MRCEARRGGMVCWASGWLGGLALLFVGCTDGALARPGSAPREEGVAQAQAPAEATHRSGSVAVTPPPARELAQGASGLADVVRVEVQGEPAQYRFEVTLKSPDVGCSRYANWWEVVRPDGRLVYRRVLGHSHRDEQPFTRSGGPVKVAARDEVIVRGHMHPGGYGGVAFRGNAIRGFVADPSIGPGFAPQLAKAPPLPEGCAF